MTYSPAIAAIASGFIVAGWELSAELLLHARANDELYSEYNPVFAKNVGYSQAFQDLAEDDITIDFKQDVSMFTVQSLIDNMVSVMENLSSNEKYKSVILTYGDQTLNLSELVYEDLEFGDFIPADHEYAGIASSLLGVTATGPTDSARDFARFVSKVSGESGDSGMDILKVTVDKLVAGTKETPINVKVTLKDGYSLSDGSSVDEYTMDFTKNGSNN